MSTQETDPLFLTEEEARMHALMASMERNKNVYVILTGDKYFVSDSKKIQPYETMLASFFKGRLVS